LGGKPNPGGGDDDPDFDDICPVPKKDEAKNEKPVDGDFFPDSKTKKQQSNEDCQLPENSEKIEIIDRINDHSGIARYAKKSRRDQKVNKDIDHLINQLSRGNLNPGKGTKKLPNFKGIFEARAEKGARVYFRNNDGKIEILAVSSKTLQDKVLNLLRTIYG
jgi:putative component of toxin-antitoxin plasmid stabilization module